MASKVDTTAADTSKDPWVCLWVEVWEAWEAWEEDAQVVAAWALVVPWRSVLVVVYWEVHFSAQLWLMAAMEEIPTWRTTMMGMATMEEVTVVVTLGEVMVVVTLVEVTLAVEINLAT